MQGDMDLPHAHVISSVSSYLFCSPIALRRVRQSQRACAMWFVGTFFGQMTGTYISDVTRFLIPAGQGTVCLTLAYPITINLPTIS